MCLCKVRARLSLPEGLWVRLNHNINLGFSTESGTNPTHTWRDNDSQMTLVKAQNGTSFMFQRVLSTPFHTLTPSNTQSHTHIRTHTQTLYHIKCISLTRQYTKFLHWICQLNDPSPKPFVTQNNSRNDVYTTLTLGYYCRDYFLTNCPSIDTACPCLSCPA